MSRTTFHLVVCTVLLGITSTHTLPITQQHFEDIVNINGNKMHISRNISYIYEFFWWSYVSGYDSHCIIHRMQASNETLYNPIIATTNINISGSLYGASKVQHQVWPLNNLRHEAEPWITTQDLPIAERYWLTSDGNIYFSSDDTPFFFVRNQDGHDFGLQHGVQPPFNLSSIWLRNYTLCAFENATDAHLKAVEMLLQKPSDLPDENVVKYPTWFTGSRVVDQSGILAQAKEIISRDFLPGQMEIGEYWESCFGSLEEDSVHFPNMTAMKSELEQMGMNLVLWVHPFINVDCSEVFNGAVEQEYLVKNENGMTTMQWWNGAAGAVDFTNENATQWWLGRVSNLVSSMGVSGISFAGGEVGHLPQPPVLHGHPNLLPNLYTRNFIHSVASLNVSGQVGTAAHTQATSLFLRMPPKPTSWDALRTLVPTLLQLNIVGYPFVMPDVIGGSADLEMIPSKELYIRWAQATTFMPAMKFSTMPWKYDVETENIIRKYINLHYQYADIILTAMNESTKTGAPVNPPIWWLTPNDEVSHKIDDEYLLSSKFLVAPIVSEKATARDIYLPPCMWYDTISKKNIKGPTWLRNYPVSLDELPFFELVDIATCNASSASLVAWHIIPIIATNIIFILF